MGILVFLLGVLITDCGLTLRMLWQICFIWKSLPPSHVFVLLGNSLDSEESLFLVLHDVISLPVQHLTKVFCSKAVKQCCIKLVKTFVFKIL